jgi:hypothetical protein
MHGDFSRGHRPDRKRGRAYRRVLLQQGRPLLDSDFNALSDANEHLLRELARDMGLGNGSPDGGFLVTTGPLLARFETLEQVTAVGTGFEARLDLRHRYEERLPSLYLDARRGAGHVTLRLRHRLSSSEFPRIRIWARLPGALRVGIGTGAEQPFPGDLASERFRAYELQVPAGVPDFDAITLRFDAASPDNEAWIGLVEGLPADAKIRPFWVSRGRYRVDGLAVELREDAPYPEVSFPKAKGFKLESPETGAYVAYLEAWERHITHVEDPQLLEPALGGTVDTCTRVEAVGQVKLAKLHASVSGLVEPEPFRAAFARPTEPSRGLRIDLRPLSVDPGSPGSPLSSGYTGAENRLYRFEIHKGGAIGTATLKWSRDNGASLFRVLRVLDGDKTLALAPSVDVRNGDVIEVLTETVELGDESDGQVYRDTAVCFEPPRRKAGELYFVREKGVTGTERLIELRDPSTRLPVALDSKLVGKPGMKIRRWDGFSKTAGDPSSSSSHKVRIDDGLSVDLTGGPFREGDYWQYEVRQGQEGTITPFLPPLNGGERLFVPLALVWLEKDKSARIDVRLEPDPSSARKLRAADVLYDGLAVPTAASTVQEALDELFARQEGDRCQVRLSPGPHGADDGERLSQLIRDKLPEGGVVCLSEGFFRLKSRVELLDKHVELHGQPGTLVVSEVPVGKAPNDSALHVGARGRLTLSGLTLVAGVDAKMGRGELISLTSDCEGLSARDCMFFHLREDAAGIVVRAAAPVLPAKEPADKRGASSAPPVSGAPDLRLEDCTLVAGWGISVGNLEGLVLHDTTVLGVGGGIVTKELGELDLHGASIDTGLVAATLQDWARRPLEQLAAAVTAWREANTVTTGLASSTALYAARVGSGTVRESTFVAGMGLWVGAGANLRLEHNHYFVGDTAVRVDHATDTVLDTETVASGNLGLHVPFVGLGLSVSGCRIQGPRAVVLGGEYLAAPTAPQRTTYPLPPVRLRDIRVSGCLIEGSRVALHLGPREADSPLPTGMEFWNLEVRENTLRATAPEALAVSGVLPGQGSDFVLRLSDNQLETRQTAVRLKGRGLELSRNRLRAEGRDTLVETPPSGVITLIQSDQGLIEGNIVQLVNLGAGICVQGSRDVRVCDNTVGCPTGARPLWVLESQRVEVRGNGLLAGRSLLMGAENLSVHDNHVAGALTIRDSRQGVVTLNRVELDEAFPLSIEQARENWRISENTAVGGIRILPAVEGVTPPATEKEREFQVQMEGNWARDLQVGYLNPADAARPGVADLAIALPHASSLVQLLGNRAQARLVVNHYGRSLITHNVMGELICAAAGSSRIHKYNLGRTSDLDTGESPAPGGGAGPLPSPRLAGGAWHSATLLPSGKVLIAGGASLEGKSLGTAFLFDPVMDSWSPTGRMSTPRSQHAAIVLESGKVLVLGGWDGTQALASAELYDPATGSWTAVPPMASARSQASATLLTTGKVLVAGGTDGASALKSAELYDPEKGSWTPLPPMATPRASHMAVRLATTGAPVLVAGGWSGSGTLSLAELYDPTSNKWTPVGEMTEARRHATVTLLETGEVLMVGGADDVGPHISAEFYDPKLKIWISTASMTSARREHTATLMPGGKVLVVGGGDGETGALASVELYDHSTGIWSLGVVLDSARRAHSATLLPSGVLLVVGGHDGTTALSSAELYLSNQRHWDFVRPPAAQRTDFTATLLPSGQVLVAGGRTGGAYHASAELYDPATGTWKPTGRMMEARYGHTATLLSSGKVLVIGGAIGADSSPTLRKSMELYDPGTGLWTSVGQLNVPRFFHAALLLPSKEVAVIGGSNGKDSLASVELVSADSSTSKQGIPLTVPRHGHTVVMDSQGRIDVWGGMNGTTVLDSFEFNGASVLDRVSSASSYSWRARAMLGGARAFHTSTMMPSGKVLLIGGRSQTAVLDSTMLYTYPDVGLDSMSSAGKMSTARIHHTATLLQSGEVLVLGGSSSLSPGAELATAELYNSLEEPGKAWTASATMASARQKQASVLLPGGEVLVVGGERGGRALSAAERYQPTGRSWFPTSSMDKARRFHTATRLQSGEVLVVGNDVRSEGGCEVYNPATRTWARATSVGLRIERHDAALLQSGKVLIAGSDDANNPFARLYTPKTEQQAASWSATGHLGMIGLSHLLLTVLESGLVLATGSCFTDSWMGIKAISHLYDPGTGTWSKTQNTMSETRIGHTTTLLSNGRALLVGGYLEPSSSPRMRSMTEVFDPETRQWSSAGSLLKARSSHTATLLPSGKVLVVGGKIDPTRSTALAELYDPDKKKWASTASLSQARSYHTATLLPSGKVLVAGGLSGSTQLNSVELYDPDKETWMFLEPMQMRRETYTATLLKSGLVLMAGGVDAGAQILAETYDEQAFQSLWRPVPPLPGGS